jgi:hypothetical protein
MTSSGRPRAPGRGVSADLGIRRWGISTVTIGITRPDGMTDTDSVSAAGGGTFTYEYTLPGEIGALGTYAVTATDTTNSYTTEFTVVRPYIYAERHEPGGVGGWDWAPNTGLIVTGDRDQHRLRDCRPELPSRLRGLADSRPQQP